MGLLRNKDVFGFSLVFLAICLTFTVTGFAATPAAGFLVLVLSVLFYGLWYWDTRRRYARIGALAGELDSILHSGKLASLSRYREGELSLLENEISKLLVKLREQAEQLDRDKHDLADSMADISHQLRTRLTTIHLALTSMSGDDLAEAKKDAYRREIARQLAQMDWLVSSLLKLSKLDAGTISFCMISVPLEVLIAKAAEPLAIPMELKNQTLVTELSGTVLCDPAWTGEAIGNILKNCTEHMDEGNLTVTAQENALYSEIRIRDSGPGIASEDLPHLFERFYRGKDTAKDSVGIGLALSRAIIAAQNGTIQARTHPRGGAEFTIRFYKATV